MFSSVRLRVCVCVCVCLCNIHFTVYWCGCLGIGFTPEDESDSDEDMEDTSEDRKTKVKLEKKRAFPHISDQQLKNEAYLRSFCAQVGEEDNSTAAAAVYRPPRIHVCVRRVALPPLLTCVAHMTLARACVLATRTPTPWPC